MPIPTSYLLIVDDSSVLLDILTHWFRETFPEKPVLGVRTIAEAHEAIAAVPIDFFLVDYRLPDGTGIELIQTVRATWPEARFILMTLDLPTSAQHSLMALNAVSSFRKPLNFCELEWALRPHIDAGAAQAALMSGAGFKTMLRGVSATDLIQLKCIEVATCALEFCNGSGAIGRVYLAAGEITHAETSYAIGIEALAEIIRWQEGTAQELELWMQPETITIGPPWHAALMEAAQLADEEGFAPAPTPMAPHTFEDEDHRN